MVSSASAREADGVGAKRRLERLGCERFDAGDGGGIQGLNKRDHEVDRAVEVGAIDNAVVRVSGAGGNKDGGHGNAAVVELDCAGIVAKSGNKIKLQRDVLRGGDLFDVGHQLSIGQFAECIEHHAGTAAEDLLSGFGAGSGHIVGNTYLQSKTDIGINDVCRGRSAAHFDAALFLDCSDIEHLIGVSNVPQPPHHFQHHSAA